MSYTTTSDLYGCDRCIHASDHYGRGCRINLMYPVMLILANRHDCPDWKFDPEKVKASLAEIASCEKGGVR